MPAKSPFVTYTAEEVFAAESGGYIVVAGTDAFEDDGNFVFSESVAKKYYNQILRELAKQVITGRKKEQDDAKFILANLRIERFRMH